MSRKNATFCTEVGKMEVGKLGISRTEKAEREIVQSMQSHDI